MANIGVQGIIVNDLGERVKVRIFRNNTCENCDCVLKDACDPDAPPQGRRGMFDIFADRSVLELEATNAAGAQVGDRIVVKIKEESSLVKAAILVYLMPGFLFLLGLFGGGVLARQYWGVSGDAEILAQLGGGIVMLVLSFTLTKLHLLTKGTSEYVPQVTEIVKQAEPELMG